MEGQWILVLFGVIAVVAGFEYFRRRVRAVRSVIDARENNEEEPLPETPTWSFASVVSDLLLGARFAFRTREVAVLELEEWGVFDQTDLADRIDTMTECYPERATWRHVRTLALARLALVSELLDEEDAAMLARRAAEALRELHSSWDALGETFVREHRDFMREGFRSGGSGLAERKLGRFPRLAQLGDNHRALARDVWPHIDFHTGEWAEYDGQPPRCRSARTSASSSVTPRT